VEICRQFADPRTVVSVKDLGNQVAASTELMESLEILSTNDAKPVTDKQAVVVDTEFGKASWQPGRAVVPVKGVEPLLPALIDFAFYEAELRRLEQAILPHQATADADVSLAYNIRESDRSQWPRLYKTMEELYRLRLQFARLEPHLYSVDRTLPLPARRMFNRLLVKAKIESRLEALSDRLETIEDLYEGACDRITDYRNYRKGSLLEVGIIVLLAVEVVLLVMHHG
jgi:hypothetical protein